MNNTVNILKFNKSRNNSASPKQNAEKTLYVQEEPTEYGKSLEKENDSNPKQNNKNTTLPTFALATDAALYSYYQLTKAAELDETLDRATRLRGAAIISNVKIITREQIEKTSTLSTLTSRGRVPLLLHDTFSETPQRFVNCLSKKTYVCPHKHTFDNQWEIMSWLTGRFEALFFDETGILVQRVEISEQKTRIIEIPPNVYHSFIALEPSSYFEIRNCSYQPETDRIYASWAAAENSPKKLAYSVLLSQAKIGDRVTLGDLND